MKKILLLSIEFALLCTIFFLRFIFHAEKSNIIDNNGPLNAIINYIIFFIFVDFMTRIFKFVYSKSQNLSLDHKDNVHFGIDNIAKLLIGIGLVIALFGAFGVDIKSLLTSLSIVAAAIAIISKDFIYDFLIGLYFSFTKNFEINDYVKLADQKGKIIEIAMLKVMLLNDDDDVVIIPNTKIYNYEITNYTKRDIRQMSIDFQLNIDAISEGIDNLEKELITSLKDQAEFIEDDSYNLKIVEMKMNYLDLKFQYKLKRLDRELQKQIRRTTVRKIFDYASSRSQANKLHN